jgi:hypothetical protein
MQLAIASMTFHLFGLGDSRWSLNYYQLASILDKTETILTWISCMLGVNEFSAWMGKCSFNGTVHGRKDRCGIDRPADLFFLNSSV